MLRLTWIASVHLRYFMRRCMPTNILLDAIRSRRGLKWGVPAMLLAVPYLYAASLCALLAERGGTGWLYLVALVCVWNALKFAWIGPVSAVLLVRASSRERKSASAELTYSSRASVEPTLKP